MLSEAGRQYQRSRRVKPLQRLQRQKVYKSQSVRVDKSHPHHKFSPFNTVDRTSRNSYLLRVTNQPNTMTNYSPKFDLTQPLERRSTIDHSKFERIIGNVKAQPDTIDLSSLNSKCYHSIEAASHRPLTVRETHDWRKTHQHFDFKKQPNTHRLHLPSKKLSFEESTQAGFMHTLENVTESNFNNFKRFALKTRTWKAHDFRSDSPHQYLKEVESREKSPEYNVAESKESFMHRAMPQTKGEKRFFLYREKIATRVDRADKNWHTYLEYDWNKIPEVRPSIQLSKATDRKPNAVHSDYPIRLSLEHVVDLPQSH